MNFKSLVIRFVMLFLLGLLVFSNGLSGKFLVDDYAFLANPATNSAKHLWLQFSPYQQLDQYADPQEWRSLAYYRPLAHIVPAICYATFGEHFWQYHLFNLILFVIASFLIYLCVFRISRSDPLSLLVSAFYIMHPINGIIVNYITASVFSIQVICITASILGVLSSIEKKHDRVSYYLSLFFFGMALLCHETSIMVPFYVGAVLVVTKKLDRFKLIQYMIPYFLILFMYLLFRTYFVSLNDLVLQKFVIYKMNFSEYGATLFTIVTWYIGQLFYPHGIVLVWASPVIRDHVVLANLGVGALLIFFIASIILFRRDKMVQIGILWFLIGFIPMVAAPFSRPYDGVDIEPHWFVFSVIGFFVLASQSFLAIIEKLGRSKRWIGALLLIVVGVSWVHISHGYNYLWSSEKLYTQYWLKQMPQLKSVHAYLGNAYKLEGDLPQARKNYLLALSGSPGDVAIYMNLGSIEKRMGHFKKAESYYLESLKMLPSSFENLANLGSLYLLYGKLDLAKKYYLSALKENPHELPLLEALILISSRENNVPDLNKYVALYFQLEKNPQMLIFLGDAMVRGHYLGIALNSYEQAAANDPNEIQIHDILIKEKSLYRLLNITHRLL